MIRTHINNFCRIPGAKNDPVEIGSRPQHLTLYGEREINSLPARVFSVEYLGKENAVVLEDEEKNAIRVLTDAVFAPKTRKNLL